MAHITFIHGIANKVAADALHANWMRILGDAMSLAFGAALTSEMVYWADVLYAEPLSEGARRILQSSHALESRADAIVDYTTPRPGSVAEQRFIAGMREELGIADAAGPKLERIPLPWPLKKLFLERFLRDVHHYLFDSEITPRPGVTYRVQSEIRKRAIAALKRGAGKPAPHIIVAHSLGTVIAYDCLKRVAGCPAVDAMVTLGSPLGLDEVQDRLAPEWTRKDGFPHEKLKGPWTNVFDLLDVVAFPDPVLRNDFRHAGHTVIEDLVQENNGLWRHDSSEYLKGAIVSSAIARLIKGG